MRNPRAPLIAQMGLFSESFDVCRNRYPHARSDDALCGTHGPASPGPGSGPVDR